MAGRLIRIALIACLTWAFSTTGHLQAQRIYMCSKCSLYTDANRTPSSSGCYVGGSHRWHCLGEVGPENYMCKKCCTTLECRRTPSTSGCPGQGSHQWYHLGHMGPSRYSCKKCGTHIKSARTPSSSGCCQGGSHRWTKLGESSGGNRSGIRII